MDRDLYKEYCWARHEVQMENACLVEMHLEKYLEDCSGELVNEIGVGRRVAIEEGKHFGYIKVEVVSVRNDTKEKVFRIEIIYRGHFTGQNIEDLPEFIYKQIVPQLYPFVRGSIATVTGLMGIPVITLPTIDVLAGLEKND